MLLIYELEKKPEGASARASFIETLERRSKSGDLISDIVFSKRKVSTYYYFEKMFILYYLETSLPSFFYVGWVLFAFFWLMGFSWLWLVLPFLLGLSGFFYSRPWFEIAFKLAMRKAKVKGRRVSSDYFLVETNFKGVGGIGSD